MRKGQHTFSRVLAFLSSSRLPKELAVPSAVQQIVDWDAHDDDSDHPEKDSAVACVRDDESQQVRPDAESQVKQDEIGRSRQSEAVRRRYLDGHSLCHRVEVAVSEADQGGSEQQHPAGSCLAEQQHADRKEKQAWVRHNIRTLQIKQLPGERAR